jgi:hypothetical protein
VLEGQRYSCSASARYWLYFSPAHIPYYTTSRCLPFSILLVLAVHSFCCLSYDRYIAVPHYSWFIICLHCVALQQTKGTNLSF